MTRVKGMLLTALAVTAAGCSWRQTPVPIIANGGAVSALVGEWSGEYDSRDTGRSGTIIFRLKSANDSAYGDVLMTPGTHVVHVAESPADRVVPPVQISMEPLQIRFVELEGSRVFGTLEPYRDPECGCAVTTTFEGRFTNESTIEGTFMTRGSDFSHQLARGKWKVTRRTIVTRTP
jgi:hypothetical protein